MTARVYQSKPLSLYRNIKTGTQPAAITARDYLESLRLGTYAAEVSALRAARGTANYDRLKGTMPAIGWGAFLPNGRKETDISELTGLVFLDWDQHDAAPDAELRDAQKARVAQQPGVVACYQSCGGDGLHIIVSVEPVPTSKWEYEQAWLSCVQAFQLRADRKNDMSVKHPNRLAIVSYDPAAYINLDAEPLIWTATARATASTTARAGEFAGVRSASTAVEAMDLIARHYGSKGVVVGDTQGLMGIHLACPYHGGGNASTLHLFAEARQIKLKGQKEPETVYALKARCFYECAKSNTLLRFITMDTGIRWTDYDSIRKTNSVDALLDVLDLLRLELRMTLPDGSIEVRAKHVGGSPLPGDAFNFGLDGWAPAEEWRAFKKPLEAHIGCVADRFFDLGVEKRAEAILDIAAGNAVDPVREWLDTLPEWDGVKRLDTLIVNALGAAPGDISAAFGRVLVGAVARIRKHGAVHDWLAVLIGEQGIGKSRFARELLPAARQEGWYAEGIHLDSEHQKIMEGIGGSLIVEFSEMGGLGSADRKFKDFLSVRFDRWRRPYAHNSTETGRRWIAIGTANGDIAVPSDPTGSRRYLAIECAVDGGDMPSRWGYVAANRNQLWAEASHIWETWDGEGLPPNLLPHSLRSEQEATNVAFTAANDWLSELAIGLEGHKAAHPYPESGATLKTLWEIAHTKAPVTPGTVVSLVPIDLSAQFAPPMRRKDSQDFAVVLKAAGWKSKRLMVSGLKAVRWYYPQQVKTTELESVPVIANSYLT